MAAELSNARNAFDGRAIARPGTTLFYTREEEKGSRLSYFLGFGGVPKRFIVDDTTTFDCDADWDELEAQMSAQWERTKPQFVVIDTLAKFYGSQQSRSIVNRAQAVLERLAKKYQVAVALLHHPKKNSYGLDEWCGGTGAIEAGVRYGLLLAKLRKTELYVMTAKYQYDEWPDPKAFVFERTAPSSNKPISTMRIYRPSTSAVHVAREIVAAYIAELKGDKKSGDDSDGRDPSEDG